MRLIDADELLNDLKKWRGLDKNTYEAAVETINNQPTAYDVDKAVERLEVNAMFEEKDEAFVMLDDAVEIVKSGGGTNLLLPP